jgi:polar amino acid transport system permease protein
VTPDPDPDPDPVPGRAAWSPSPRELERRRQRRRQRTRSLLVATAAVVVVFAGLGLAVVSSPGWPRVQALFFDWDHAQASFPEIRDRFWVNVKLFLLAEPVILLLALAVALARSSRAALLVPLRLIAVVYTDLFRGIPTILLILLLGFGMPALRLQGVPNSALFWAGVGLVLSYGAYVAEVFRAGIESIHPSQVASAEALGLSRGQTMRFVVVPQAVRRVVPPLLNDFVSLQKDTALVAVVGGFDAVFAARDYGNFNFNYTPYVVVAVFFVLLTVPLARLTDWLQRRYAERERAGAR